MKPRFDAYRSGDGRRRKTGQVARLGDDPTGRFIEERRAIDMDVAGTIDITVAGERWTAVTSLAGCGPEDRCYAIAVGRTGAATVRFGDGATGRRPSPGAAIEASFRYGGGATGNVAEEASDDRGIALVEALARVADILSQYQDQIASEAYLETARERFSLSSLMDVTDAIAGRENESRVCFCLRPVGRPEQRRSD